MRTAKRRPTSPDQTASCKKRLLERRSRLTHELRAQLGALRRYDRKRVSDASDVAVNDLQDAESLQLATMEMQELRKIDGAIRRIAAGAFDVCEECGGGIGHGRLRALPHATLCVGCQEELERTAVPTDTTERWSQLVDADAEVQRAHGVPDRRLDGVDRAY